MKVSVIIPVYNAERCLKESLSSITAQSYRDFEVVFVDDCSTDGSSHVMEQFRAESGLPCKIIRQQENGGVAAARNKGMDAAEGEYIAFLDADDRMEPDALEKGIQAAENNAEIVGWDWTLGFEKNGRIMRQADYDTPLQALKNLLGGTMRWNLWLFLLRRDFIREHGLHFIDGASMGEDMMLMISAFSVAKKVVQIHTPLYRYNAVSSSSISRQFSEARRKEIERNLQQAESAIRASRYSIDLSDHIQYLKLFLKLPLLIGSDKNQYRLWYNWFPESNRFATANRALPARTRFLQWMASKRLWLGVKTYYLLVYRFVYGIIYR